MITVYGRTTSFNVQKVMWLVEELSLEFKHVELGGKYGGLDNKDFSSLNPLRKVPVLQDGDISVWESHTILRYLVAKYGKPGWYDEDPFKRSLYERWMDWSQTRFQPAFMTLFWGYYRMPQEKRNMATIGEGLRSCDDCLNILDKQLSNKDYLTGEVISLADITAGAVLFRLTEQGLNIKLPDNVSLWYERLKTRPGYQKWVMSDFSELKSREDF